MMVLLFAALLLQESPQDVFNKIESAIEKAGTIQVRLKVDSSSRTTQPGAGSFSVDAKGRMNLSIELKENKRTSSLTASMEGKTLKGNFMGDAFEAPCDPRLQRSNCNMYLSRMGIFTGALFELGFSAGAARGGEPLTLDLKQSFGVQNLRIAGDGPRGTKILAYDFRTAFSPSPITGAQIWYDPKTYTLVRRECTLKWKDFEGQVIEVYEEIVLDGGKAGAAGDKPGPAADPPIPDAQLAGLFIQAKIQVAEQNIKSGKKAQAVQVLEDLIATYPQHPKIGEARRLLEEARKP